MHKVYALSAKGKQECGTDRPTLPADLGRLLHEVDGARTGYDLLAATGRSAVTAGGLRWLQASGYIQARSAQHAPSGQSALPTAPASAPAAITVAAPVAASQSSPTPAQPRRPSQVGARADAELCRILSDFMLQSIRRRLGEAGYPHRRQIERAGCVRELLPHLNPLIDAIAARADAIAGAEFADTAAFILSSLAHEAAPG